MSRNSKTRTAIALTVLCAVAPAAASAAPGDLDPSFGRFGRTLIDPARSASSSGIAVQPDGKPLIAGFIYSAGGIGRPSVVRLNADGSVDESFGSGGVAPLAPPITSISAIRLDAAGRIVLGARAGELASSTAAVARLNTDGSIDPSFGAGGIDDTGVQVRTIFGADNLALAPDGRIVLAAGVLDSSSLIVFRRLADGGADPSFSGDGTAEVPLGAGSIGGPVAVAPDGSVFAGGAGTQPSGTIAGALLKLGAGGEPDPAFASGGIAWTTFDGGANLVGDLDIGLDGTVHALALDRNRFSYLGASAFIARYTPAGALDPGFSGDGWLATRGDSGRTEEIAVQPDGRVVAAAGEFNGDAQVLRYRADGTRDRAFADRGRATIDLGGDLDTARHVAIGPGGKLAIGGARGIRDFRSDSFDLAAARLLNGGRRHDLDADGLIDRKDLCPKVSAKARGGCPLIARKVRLLYSRQGTFQGKVSSANFRCRPAGKVAVFQQVRGRDLLTHSTTRIDPSGNYEMRARNAEGTFYARLRAKVVPDAGRCAAARSKTVLVGP